MKLDSVIVISTCASILASGNLANASPYSRAFEEFEDRCVARMMQDENALDTMQVLSVDETERFFTAFGAGSNRDNLEARLTASDRFFLVTIKNDDRFCQLVGLQVDFQEFQSAFRNWRAEFGIGYRANSTFELKTRQIGNKENSIAGIFMVKSLGGSDFLQLTIQYRPDFLDGYASILVIRLPQKTPAARELFPDGE